MKILSIIALGLCLIPAPSLPQKFTIISSQFQKICKDMLPGKTSEKENLASLVCGEKVQNLSRAKTLQKTGLIHIFVVSGGHLILISELLIHLKWAWPLRLAFLTLFTFFTGFQIPCVRSLLQFSLSELLGHSKHHLRADQRVFFCGVFLLIFYPSYASSLSLQLSWGAALALALHQQLTSSWGFFLRLLTSSFSVYFMMYPLLSIMSGLHPLSILWNISLGTVASFVLFPLAGLAMFFAWPLEIFEKLMPLFWLTVERAEQLTSAFPALDWKLHYGWIWIFTCQGLGHIYLTHFHRRNST